MTSSPEQPIPVRTVARAMADWIGRLGRIWVEGQVTEVSRRGGQPRCFFVLRDTAADMSLQVSCPRQLVDELQPPLADGARVVVWLKPDFWTGRGQLSMTAYDVRPVGVGALLARLEQLRATLAAEGLFAADRKKALPFLPAKVGLVTGRESAAERDVVENARRRWPGVAFAIENVAVQGPYAASEIIAALRRLDDDPVVEVIVVARGGGSVEDLLPFSDEALIRAVASCRTPVVTAIGHETDAPLVDHVADRRASTPTDAAKLVVPDVAEELHRVRQLRARAHRHLAGRIDAESHRLVALLSRPSIADPLGQLDRYAADLAAARERSRRAALGCVATAASDIAHLAGQVAALSPQATLDRGYAVVQRADGHVVRDPLELAAAEHLDVRVAAGRFAVTVAEAS
ncbi:MAG: exodeoxyribonuclease large subunit [Frankiaceae bacterium]|nr:exodeoxyribonuclease large subunit [Frankiaceae bacterium]